MTLADDDARTRAAGETSSSFLVEASAGTGKTKTLIDRIRNLVLVRGVPLRRIAAMTFTEKSAGEMKARLREKLDEALAGAAGAEERERALRARFELEGAEISTIHSFCSRLLRERPVEAGVDPDFVAGDELLAADLADETFAAWFDREARRGSGPVADALRAGADPAALHDLAKELYEARLVLDRATLPTDSLAEVREEIGALREEWEGILDLFATEHREDEKARQVRSALEELASWQSLALEEFRDAGLRTVFHLGRGSRSALDDDGKARFKAAAEATKELANRFESLPLVPVLTSLVGEIRRSFFPEIEAAKRQRGLLDFDDLLLKARDLLRDSRAAREHFHARFETLVVDEFQDTDPVQAEIVMRLAAPPEEQDDDWSALSPEPGRLFLVGDPKQSIYRFRRADVETYGQARERIAERLELSTNFRSSRPLVAFVNAVGPALLPPREGGDGWRVPYAPLTPGPGAEPGPLPGVVFIAPPRPDEEAPSPSGGIDEDDDEQLKVHDQEARAVANLLRSRFGGRERPWRRIAVLVPRHKAIDHLQIAFRDAGIPFVLEGGRSFYRREEVAAILAALAAVDDPSDAISVVAALKSVLFGASDAELLAAAESGVRFDDLAAVPPDSPLGPAAGLLVRLHAGRHARPLAETLADLLASTHAVTSVENGAVVNPVQGVANLERLLVLARDLDREGLSFREATARLRRRIEEDAPEPAARVEEDDAVRLMTLHKAKGLQFPVVVLADLGLKEQKRRGPRAAVLCEKAGGRFGVRLRFGGLSVGTARLSEVEEQDEERQEAEMRRLLYVGVTRAREELVISWFRRRTIPKKGKETDSLGKSYLAPLARFESPSGSLASLVTVVPADLSVHPRPEALPARGEETDLSLAMAEAERRLERVRATASRPLRRAGEKDAGTAFTHEDAEPSDRDEAPDRARRIGVAVHAAMEALLSKPAVPNAEAVRNGIGRACEGLFEDERREVAALVENLLCSSIVSRAFASPRRFVELPLLYVDVDLPGKPLVEGKIDLLFDESDGWQIVDWKTDRIATPADRLAREELYAPQLDAYEQGLRKILGPEAVVKKGLLVFARPIRA